MALKWMTRNANLQKANFGPFELYLKRDPDARSRDQDPWTAYVAFAASEVALDGGERYLTPEQAKDAVMAWCVGTLQQMNQDIS